MDTSPPSLQSHSPPCPLLRLPSEIRSLIFSHYFLGLEFQLLSKRKATIPYPNTNNNIPLQCRSNSHPNTKPLSLLSVSQQIRLEALPQLGRAHIIITALFNGWHGARSTTRDTLSIPPIHAASIRHVELRFLDSNFAILQALPNIEFVSIIPPGELRCQRYCPNPADNGECWSTDEINGDSGWKGMKSELGVSMALMHRLLDPGAVKLKFQLRFSVGFKFLVVPLHYPYHGRLVATRENYYSVHCVAIGHFDSMLGAEGDTLEIQSVSPVQH